MPVAGKVAGRAILQNQVPRLTTPEAASGWLPSVWCTICSYNAQRDADC